MLTDSGNKFQKMLEKFPIRLQILFDERGTEMNELDDKEKILESS